MHAVRRSVLVAAATSGTQSIKVTEMADIGEVPKGMRIYATNATANATDTNQARWSDYFVDSAENTAGCSAQAEHGSASTDTDKYAADDGTVVALINAAGSIQKRATFGAWVDGGAEIVWTASVAGAVILHIEFLFGDNILTAVGQDNHLFQDPDKLVNVGFLPDHIETVAARTVGFLETVGPKWDRHLAHIVRDYDSATPNGLAALGDHIFQQLGNNKPAGHSSALSDSGFGVSRAFTGGPFFILGLFTNIVGFDPVGFKINSSGSGAAGTPTMSFAYMAISYGRHNRVAMQRITSPTSTGTVPYDFGWEPWVLKTITQNMTANQTHGDKAAHIGLGYADRLGQHHAGTLEDHGAGTTDTQSRSDNNRFMRASIGTGSTVTYESDVSSWDPCGVTLNYQTVDGTARRTSIIALEKDHIQGCSKVTAPFPSSTGVGLLGVTGTAQITAPFPTASATGKLKFLGQGVVNVVAPFPSALAVGLVGVIGTASVTAPFPTALARGRLKFHAAGACVRAPFPVVAAIGLRGYIGLAQVTAPFPTASGAGILEIRGTSAPVAPFPEVTASGLIGFIGQAQITAPFPVVIAGGCTHAGGGGGGADHCGFARVLAPFPIATGAGVHTPPAITGAAAFPAPFPRVIADGKLKFIGDAVGIRSPFPSVTAAGVLEFRAMATAITPFPGAVSIGKLKFLGTSAPTAPFPVVTSVGFLKIIGTSTPVAPFPVASGAGLLHFLGQSTIIAPFPSSIAVGTTDPLVPDACAEVDLVAEYDGEVDLVAQYDGEVDLAASYEQESDLVAEYDLDADLAAEYDGEADLTAECE